MRGCSTVALLRVRSVESAADAALGIGATTVSCQWAGTARDSFLFPRDAAPVSGIRAPCYKRGSPGFLLSIATMNFFADFLKSYVELMGRANLIGQVFIWLMFCITVVSFGSLVFLAVVLLIAGLCQWLSGTVGNAAVVPAAEELIALPVADAVVPLAGDEQAARSVLRRRHAARGSAPAEPGSSSSHAAELERE